MNLFSEKYKKTILYYKITSRRKVWSVNGSILYGLVTVVVAFDMYV